MEKLLSLHRQKQTLLIMNYRMSKFNLKAKKDLNRDSQDQLKEQMNKGMIRVLNLSLAKALLMLLRRNKCK